MKSQIQKKKKKEWWNCKITNTVPTFFQKKLLMKAKCFLGKKIMGRLF